MGLSIPARKPRFDVEGGHTGALRVGGATLADSLARLRQRLELSKAKHRSVAGHARMARRLAGLIPFYEYDEARFFCSDGAPADVAARRRNGFERLSSLYRTRFAETIRETAEAAESISDLQFTDAYRVPFQYRELRQPPPAFGRLHRRRAKACRSPISTATTSTTSAALTASTCSATISTRAPSSAAAARMRDLGPVLGPYHPVIAENVEMLKEISGLDEVSFHMSGTEAVMQAVRLARYHTRRSHLVRFCGAYHGWWGDVQPGIGNPLPAHETYTLARYVAKKRCG